MSNFLLKLKALAANDTVRRVVKTVVEVVAAQTALYTTVVPSPPNTNTSAAIAGGAGVLALVWNLAIVWATAAKSKRLQKLADAIDAAVNQRLSLQAEANVPTEIPKQP